MTILMNVMILYLFFPFLTFLNLISMCTFKKIFFNLAEAISYLQIIINCILPCEKPWEDLIRSFMFSLDFMGLDKMLNLMKSYDHKITPNHTKSYK